MYDTPLPSRSTTDQVVHSSTSLMIYYYSFKKYGGLNFAYRIPILGPPTAILVSMERALFWIHEYIYFVFFCSIIHEHRQLSQSHQGS